MKCPSDSIAPIVTTAVTSALATYLCQSENRKRVFIKVKDWMNSLKVSVTRNNKTTVKVEDAE